MLLLLLLSLSLLLLLLLLSLLLLLLLWWWWFDDKLLLVLWICILPSGRILWEFEVFNSRWRFPLPKRGLVYWGHDKLSTLLSWWYIYIYIHIMYMFEQTILLPNILNIPSNPQYFVDTPTALPCCLYLIYL